MIDDGLLRVELEAEGYEDKVVRVLEVIEKVYQMANLYISWDKTFVSEHTAVFLNEFYHRGTPVTPGIRAFLKITADSETICPSLLDDLGILDSTCRGAIAAGSMVNVAYAAYCFNFVDRLTKWGKGKAILDRKLSLVAFTPVAFGGLGAVSMQGLSGSIMGPAIVEGIGNLRAIAVRFPVLVPAINRIVNQPMRTMSVTEKARAPLAGRRVGRVLRSTRAKVVIEKRLLHMLDTPVIRALMGDVSVRQVDDVLSVIAQAPDVAIEALEIAHQSSVAHAIENLAAKFLRSRTASKLVSVKAFFRATIANITEARELLREWSH